MNNHCPRCGHHRPTGTRCQPCRNRRQREANARTDPIAIDTTVHNRRATPGLRPHEQRAAARQFTNLGLSAAEIARILAVTPRTVHRWRARDRENTSA
ncbi:helix-turn-helix domain-containing protein [Streptomyces sp. NPDC052114]|uniref:helix-turn-helix domain-containing protein n=1 Tax=unclassified Streptomyces TaxID=2593676 RepID=UPI00342EE8D6